MRPSKYDALIPTYAENVRRIFDLATPEDIEGGVGWYPLAARIVRAIADWAGMAPDRTAAIMAALSPRNPWKWNAQDTAAFAWAIAHDLPMPSATTFMVNRVNAWRLGSGAEAWRTAAPKVRSFVANIMGDLDAVTVDVWAARVATLGVYGGESIPVGQYRAIATAYRRVAADVELAPRDLQATTWIVAERIALGSQRRGRGHAATIKRGTLPFVAELLAA